MPSRRHFIRFSALSIPQFSAVKNAFSTPKTPSIPSFLCSILRGMPNLQKKKIGKIYLRYRLFLREILKGHFKTLDLRVYLSVNF